MSRYAKHFLVDVLRHTALVACIALLLLLVQATFDFMSGFQRGEPPIEVLLVTSRKLLVQLGAFWPLVVGLGLGSALAHWSRSRQDAIVASSGWPMRRVVGMGFLAAVALQLSGARALESLAPPPASRQLTAQRGDEWGAALQHGDAGWQWVAVRRDPDGWTLRRGRADLADALREETDAPWTPPATIPDRLAFGALFVALIGILCTLSLAGGVRFASTFNLATPIVAWFVAGSLRSLVRSLLIGVSAAGLSADLAALAVVGAAGLVVLGSRRRLLEGARIR